MPKRPPTISGILAASSASAAAASASGLGATGAAGWKNFGSGIVTGVVIFCSWMPQSSVT